MTHKEWNNEAQARKEELHKLFRETNGRGVSENDRKEMAALCKLHSADDQRRFGDMVPVVTSMLYAIDPISLVPCEVPKDEYDIEARMILREISPLVNPTVEEIANIARNIFVSQFDEASAGASDRECYTQIAKALLLRQAEWQGK